MIMGDSTNLQENERSCVNDLAQQMFELVNFGQQVNERIEVHVVPQNAKVDSPLCDEKRRRVIGFGLDT